MKKGISLIVLVITIIVMIILASAVVVTLSNTGIINTATEAVDAANTKEVQDLANLVWADEYLNGKKGTELVEAVLNKMQEYKDKYEIVVNDSGVSVSKKENGNQDTGIPADWQASVREVTLDGVPIPKGFVKSPYENEGTKDKGLVIYALTSTEIAQGKTTITDDYKTALETRNQFVWIPVDNFETEFKRVDYPDQINTVSNTLGVGYWEIVVDENNMPSDASKNTTDYVSSATLAEATAMYRSVKKYGGFYIARYEVGTSTVTWDETQREELPTRVSVSAGTNSNLSITMSKYPYGYIGWGTTMSNEVHDSNAVSLARGFYPESETTYGVVSTLTYGVQWDRILSWWKELDPTIDYADSTEYGTYFNTTLAEEDVNAGAKKSVYTFDGRVWQDLISKPSMGQYTHTTGASKKACVYNIYDMAGNMDEWTMEGLSQDYRMLRGGNRNSYGNSTPVVRRGNYSVNSTLLTSIGFRPTLYIK